jgi:uncharacterized protein (TIGR04255 family)
MQPKLKKPPLIEAVCEVRLDPSTAWDLTIAGRLFEKLQPEYPERRQTLGVELKLNVPQPPDYRQIENLQFLSKDGKNVVQVREYSVSVSRLAPYEAWESYKPTVVHVFEKFREISSGGVIARVGLKYVNRIVVPKPEIRLEDFLNFYPFVGHNLPESFGPFLVGVVFPYQNPSGSLRTEATSADPEVPGQYNILLSLDHFATAGEGIKFEGLAEWLEVAHGRIEGVFRAALTDSAMRLFE